MKALLLEDIGKIGVGEVPEPVPGQGQVLLKIKAAAICRTDAKMWKMGHRDLVLPRILGHEICAVRTDDGKRHVVWPGTSCGKCEYCNSGLENLCGDMKIMGFHSDGGMAEFAVASEAALIEVPEGLSDGLASLAEPVACTMNAVKMGKVQPGQKVLIIGGGPVGLMMALAIKGSGADPTVSEINPEKRELSRSFQEKTGIPVKGELPEGGYHVAINAAPSLAAFQTGIKKLLTGGTFCIFSGFTDVKDEIAKEIVNVLNEIHYRQLKITSAYGCTRDQMRSALELIEKRADDFSLLIQKTLVLEEAPDALSEIWNGNALRHVIEFE